jgi:hypothetical protein
MKVLTGSAVLVGAVLVLSACGGSARAISGGPRLFAVSTTLPAPLAKRLAAEARGTARSLGDPSVKTAQVYGPDSRYLLVKSSSGDLVQRVASERKGFYLIVLHGHFVCRGCTGPAPGAKPARGKVATEVWSPRTGQTDFGLGNRPVAVSHLKGPAVVVLAASASARTNLSGHVSEVQFTYPRRYHLRRFTICGFAVTGDRKGGCDRGVVIASYPLKALPEIGGSGARFSSKGVALELYRPPADNGVANVKLGKRRLSLWQFNAADDGLNLPGRKPPPPEQWGAWFRVNGASYWAIAWVGTNAKRADRATLAALINSVHVRGQTPQAPSPKPAPQVTRVLCGGTAGSTRVPPDALAGGSGSGSYLICAQVSGRSCRVWTRLIGAPAADVRQRHYQLRASFCAYTRRFLRHDPRGYSVQPARPGLTALLRHA